MKRQLVNPQAGFITHAEGAKPDLGGAMTEVGGRSEGIRDSPEDGRGAGFIRRVSVVGAGAAPERRKITSETPVSLVPFTRASATAPALVDCLPCKVRRRQRRELALGVWPHIACCTEQRFTRCKGAQDANRLCINRSRCNTQR